MSLRIELINSKDAFEQLEADWNGLYEKSDHCTVFSSWDWMYTWWDVFGEEPIRELYILCVYDGEKLLGIAPFQIEKKFPIALIVGRKLQFIGAGEANEDSILSEFGDLIISNERQKEVCDLFNHYLFTNDDWDYADFNYLLESSLILQFFKGHSSQLETIHSKFKSQISKSGVRYFIPKVDHFEDYHQTLGKRWAKMYTKKNRKLERDGEVKIIQSESEVMIERDLDVLVQMHRSRWTERTDHLIFDSKRFHQFHKNILKRLAPKGKAYIRTLTLNDEPLAAYYAFTDKSQVHYYQSGFYAEKANLYSPLFILVCKEIGLTNENNQLFDFMFSEEKSYKQTQYAAKSEDIYRLMWTHKSYRLALFNGLKRLKISYEKMCEFMDKLIKKKKK